MATGLGQKLNDAMRDAFDSVSYFVGEEGGFSGPVTVSGKPRVQRSGPTAAVTPTFQTL
jgi:hypothetical protein